MTTTPAEEIDVSVCALGNNTIDVSIEGGVQSVNVPWDGSSFSGAAFTAFSVSSVIFPAMTIAGKLLSKDTMEVTVSVQNSGSAKFNIPFTGEIC